MIKLKIFYNNHLNFKLNTKNNTSFWKESSLLDYVLLLICEFKIKTIIIYSTILNLNLSISDNLLFKLYVIFFKNFKFNYFFKKNKIDNILLYLLLTVLIIIILNIILIL